MRRLRVWKTLLGLRRTVVEQVEFDETEEVVVVSVRPRARARERDRCPHCRRRCGGYDEGEGRRRWRLVRERTRLINELRWQLHDLWPDWLLAKRMLTHPAWQVKVVRRLQAADPAQVRVRIARDMIRRVRELTRTITISTSSSPAWCESSLHSCWPRRESGC